MMVTPEECYAFWHKEWNRFENKRVRAVKNFTNAKNRDYWDYFEQFANLVNRNRGKINYKIFITSLADQFGGYYNPCNLTKRRSLKIYRSYIKEKEANNNVTAVKDNVFRSLKFIVDYCQEKEIKNFNDYLCEDMYMIPTILKHLDAGSISAHFLACIPDFDLMLQSYPVDVVQDFGQEIKEKYSVYRMKIIHMDNDLLTKVINKNEQLFNTLIKRNKKK